MNKTELKNMLKEINPKSVKGYYFDNISNANDGVTEYNKFEIRFYIATKKKIHVLVLFHHDCIYNSVESIAFSINRNLFDVSFKNELFNYVKEEIV